METTSTNSARPPSRGKERRRLAALYVATLLVALVASAVIDGALDVSSWLVASVAAAIAMLLLSSVAMLEYRPHRDQSKEPSP